MSYYLRQNGLLNCNSVMMTNLSRRMGLHSMMAKGSGCLIVTRCSRVASFLLLKKENTGFSLV